MFCRVGDFRYKDVICVGSGVRLGSVCDMEVDTESARLTAIIIYGRYRFFGLLGREEDIVIHWNDIQLIGEDTILVNFNAPPRKKGRFSFFSGGY